MIVLERISPRFHQCDAVFLEGKMSVVAAAVLNKECLLMQELDLRFDSFAIFSLPLAERVLAYFVIKTLFRL